MIALVPQTSHSLHNLFSRAQKEFYPWEQWNVSHSTQEDEKQILISLTLPGVKKEDIAIELRQKVLTVTYPGFSRSYQLRGRILPDEIKASLEYGILSITIPKEPIEVKKIEITTGA